MYMIDVFTKLKDVCHKLNNALIQWNFKDCVPLFHVNVEPMENLWKIPRDNYSIVDFKITNPAN